MARTTFGTVIPMPPRRPSGSERAALQRQLLIADYGLPQFPTPEELQADFREMFLVEREAAGDVPPLPPEYRPVPRTLVEAYGWDCPIEPMPAWTWQLKVRDFMVGRVPEAAVGIALAICGTAAAWVIFFGGGA